MMNRFILNETSYHGRGAIKSITKEIKMRGLKKALICTTPE
ncbi:MAG: lactaldehyde reductase, partial [Bacilli bacterium]|nr:lactaldehyde reductase [Bacilli bacterium]